MRFAKGVVKFRIPILILTVALMIPSVLGMISTRVNYDMLTYLPEDMETVIGQNELMEDFSKGAFTFLIFEDMPEKDVVKLKQKVEAIDHVDTVLWYDSLADISIPMEILPDKIYKEFNSDHSTLMAVFFDTGTSDDRTMEAVSEIRSVCGRQCFVFGMTVTVATNEIFNALDTEKLNSIDDLAGSADELTAGMTQLLNGSSALYEGLCSLLGKSGELVSGISRLAEGALSLKDGTASLDEGVALLGEGVTSLSDGLETISSGSNILTGGAKQVFDSLLKTASDQLRSRGLSVPELTADNYEAVLDSLTKSLDSKAVYSQALKQVTAAVEANRSVIQEKVTAAVREQVEVQVTSSVREQIKEKVTASLKGNVPEKDLQSLVEANTSTQMESEQVLSLIKTNTDAQMETKQIRSKISENTDAQVKKAIEDNMASDEVQSKLSEAAEGVQSIEQLKESLNSYREFYAGIIAYTEGVDTAAGGAAIISEKINEMKAGTSQLKDGAAKLSDGLQQLKSGLPALTEGIEQLKDGSMSLTEGLHKFSDEGIQKIADILSGDISTVLTRLKATADVSNRYTNFSGISNGMDGQVKFIYRTDEIQSKG